MLDGDTCEVQGVGFAASKGLRADSGGARWVPGASHHQTVRPRSGERGAEAGSALARLRTDKNIVLHYAPIEGTVEGEPREIYPYLGAAAGRAVGRYV